MRERASQYMCLYVYGADGAWVGEDKSHKPSQEVDSPTSVFTLVLQDIDLCVFMVQALLSPFVRLMWHGVGDLEKGLGSCSGSRNCGYLVLRKHLTPTNLSFLSSKAGCSHKCVGFKWKHLPNNLWKQKSIKALFSLHFWIAFKKKISKWGYGFLFISAQLFSLPGWHPREFPKLPRLMGGSD